MTAAVWSTEDGDRWAPVVVLVHGSMDRSAGLLRVGRRLARSYRVVRYDRRGYGRSAAHTGPFGIDDQVEDLVGVLGGRPAVVFGHSYGGNVALATADRHPELVSAIAVYEAPLSWRPWWPMTTAGSSALAGDGDAADAAERFMRRLIGDDRWERLPPSARAARRGEGTAMLTELADLRTGAPWDPARITMPVIAAMGERSAPHHRRAMTSLADELPACRLVEVIGAKHFGPNTHPDVVAGIIDDLFGWSESAELMPG